MLLLALALLLPRLPVVVWLLVFMYQVVQSRQPGYFKYYKVRFRTTRI